MYIYKAEITSIEHLTFDLLYKKKEPQFCGSFLLHRNNYLRLEGDGAANKKFFDWFKYNKILYFFQHFPYILYHKKRRGVVYVDWRRFRFLHICRAKALERYAQEIRLPAKFIGFQTFLNNLAESSL